MLVISVYLFIELINPTSSHSSVKWEVIVHHCYFMDHITSYGSSRDHESMSLALKVNIIRRPDDQLEINISDGFTE